MARVTHRGHVFEAATISLSDRELARIEWSAAQRESTAKDRDHQEAYAALRRAARDLMALRGLK